MIGFLKVGEKAAELWEHVDGHAVEVSHVFETAEEAAASGLEGLKHRGEVVKKWGAAAVEAVEAAVADVVEDAPKKHKKKH